MPIQSKRAPRGPVKSPFSSKKRHLVESLVAAQLLICSVIATPSQAGQLAVSAFTPYNASAAASIVAGPFALYTVKLNSVMPTQMDEGLAEVAKKTAGFNLETSAQMQATMQTYVEPVVIGPGGVLYLTDGHHTFTALANSIWGASNPTVYVNVIANYSNLSTAQFYAQMQSVNLLLPLNDGVPQPVNGATGSPIPTSLTSMASDVYRGLEYSILKNKSSKLFSTSSNLTGAVGASTPGLDKMTGAYVDFVEAQAYRDANGGLGLPYLSPADIALATQWNLNATSTSTLPGVATTLTAAQLPGFILSGNISNAGGISNNTLTTGALDGNGGFTGQDYVNLGTSAHPIWIGTPNVGFVMELGNDTGKSVTLNGTNTYTGGTTITAGNLIVASDAALGAPAPASYTINRPIAVDGEVATINLNGNALNLTGPIVSLGTAGVGIGNATGVSDLTFDDLSAAGNLGKVVLSTPSPLFYGNLIIGNAGVPTVEVMSDAAMGNTTGAAASIGAVDLNGGTLQTGASFAAPERNLFHHQMVPDKKCDVVEDILVLQACEQCPGDMGLAGWEGTDTELPDDEVAAVKVLADRMTWLAGLGDSGVVPAGSWATVGAQILNRLRAKTRAKDIAPAPLPPMDEAFFKAQEVATLDELKTRVRQSLKFRKEQENRAAQRRRADPFAQDGGRATGDGLDPQQGAHQGALAAAARPEEPHEFARRDGEVDGPNVGGCLP